MSKQKPVWRINTGRGVPSDATGLVYKPDSNYLFDSTPENLLFNGRWILNGWLDIYA